MIAHHTAGGCPLQVGDLLGSGTISGTGPGTAGSLLELTFNGRSKIQVGANAERAFLEDHDTITMTGWAGDTGGGLVGFGDSVGKIVPAFKSPE